MDKSGCNMKRVLLLNATWEPLHFISEMRAIALLVKGRAELINVNGNSLSLWDEFWRSPTTAIQVPATLRLLTRITKKWKPPRFRKKVLFNRDNWECQYCKSGLNYMTITIDHILPSSRGGGTSWHNCVSACKTCNRKKGCKTPDEAGMRLLSSPKEPETFHFWDTVRTSIWHNDWDSFFPNR